jgi:hypothetical protein
MIRFLHYPLSLTLPPSLSSDSFPLPVPSPNDSCSYRPLALRPSCAEYRPCLYHNQGVLEVEARPVCTGNAREPRRWYGVPLFLPPTSPLSTSPPPPPHLPCPPLYPSSPSSFSTLSSPLPPSPTFLSSLTLMEGLLLSSPSPSLSSLSPLASLASLASSRSLPLSP